MVDENSTFGGFLTDIGEARQANANALGIPWKLTHMLLGNANDSDPVPAPDQTQLINQVYRAAINQLSVDPANPAILIAELVLPPDVGGWWIRELGLEDEDGNFVAVANCAPSYKPLLAQGSGRNQVVRMHLILSNTANVELKIDPSIVLATRDYVDKAIVAHAQSREHPVATTTEKGMTQYATLQEHLEGQRADRAAKPSGVKAAIDASIADQTATASEAQMLTSLSKLMTPGRLADAFRGGNQALQVNGFQILPGGIIVQWKSIVAVGLGEVSFSWPVAFPNACLMVTKPNVSTQAPVGSAVADIRSPGVSGGVMVHDFTTNPGGNTGTFIAVGV